MSKIPPMYEFIVWSNCNNNCKFCWQKKLNKPETILSADEKVQALTEVIKKIETLPYGDVLVVGGEAYSPQGDKVNAKLKKMFEVAANRIKAGKLRYFYMNTNLLYTDFVNIDAMYKAFNGIYDHLKFTTSWDPYGRFANENMSKLVVKNAKRIINEYPGVNVVINIILTKQFHDLYCSKDNEDDKALNINEAWQKRELIPKGITYVHLIPYIPVEDDRSMDATFGEIVACLEKADKQYPGYLENYCKNFDLDQEKFLYEYQRGKGFVDCSAPLAECGHNSNFKRVIDGEKCFICEMKDYMKDRL